MKSQKHPSVLIATYRRACKQWIVANSFYNYPLPIEEKQHWNAFKKITTIILFNRNSSELLYHAHFDRIVSPHTLSKLGYPTSKNPRSEKYALFRLLPYEAKVHVLDSHSSKENKKHDLKGKVLFRMDDFAGTPAKRQKLIDFFKKKVVHPDRQLRKVDIPLYLQNCTPEKLIICENGQMTFITDLFDGKADNSISKNRDKKNIVLYQNLQTKKTLQEAIIGEDPLEDGKYTHIDCFSGVGGFCTGLHAAGFDTKIAVEKIKSCVDTYKINHPEVHVITDDIRNVNAEQLIPFIPKKGIDLVTSGMPCETFSTAGNTSRSFYDDRQFLFREGIRVAKIARAKFLLFENVPAITTKKTEPHSNTLIIDVLKKELIDAGYANFIEVILDSTRFGVPQRRKRYFILATRLNVPLTYPHSKIYTPIRVSDAIIDIPSVTPNTGIANELYLNTSSEYSLLMRNDQFWRRVEFSSNTLTYHMPMRHRPATLERFALLKQGEGLKDLFLKYQGSEREILQNKRILPKKMFIKRNYRVPLNLPAPTVTSHCLDEFVHPIENRALTVRECARLQSFPDSYQFSGGPYIVPHIDREVQDKYEQIGDAVPPLLAYAWGRTISLLLKGLSNERI